MEAPFVYSPLVEARHIRLLQVFLEPEYKRAFDEAFRALNEAKKQAPDENSEGKPSAVEKRLLQELQEVLKAPPRVRGRFVVASLDDLPHSYKAISYVWGNPAATQKVWIDDSHYLEVTKSAMEVLYFVAMSGRDDYLWFDALCINQKDIREKGRQVRLMYDVYSRADEVVAWTGTPTNDSQLALEFISILHREIGRLRDGGTPLTRATITGADGCQWPSPKWTALAQFLRRPFFGRVWIVQEMVAAKQIRLACGNYFVDWRKLAEVVVNISATGIVTFIETLDESGTKISAGGLEGLSTIHSLRYHISHDGIPPPLPYVLSTCQNFGSTDPRDRIFALLNISSYTNDNALAPDYNKPVEAVFTDAARCMLTKPSPLISLLYSAGIGHNRKLDTLPSWVPDWSTVPPSMSFGTTADSACLQSLELYYGCGKEFELTTISICSDGASMTLKGRIIDSVTSYSDGRPKMQDQTTGASRENAVRIIEWLLRLCQIFPDNFVYPTGAPFFPDVLSHTLVAGINKGGDLLLDPVDKQFLDFFAMMFISTGTQGSEKEDLIPELILERVTAICFEMLTLDNEPAWPPELTVQNETLREAYQSCEGYDSRVRKQRKVFTTEKNYIGLGPLLMQENDIICLIYGAKAPFLIRRRAEGAYFLVGECYVHGLMHGEGMSMGAEEDIVFY